MSRVDFYVLPEGLQAPRFACTVAAKARRQGYRIHIHSVSRPDALNLDELLWTFRDISFLPHRLHDAGDNGGTPVTIGWEGIQPETHDAGEHLLINLAPDIPDFAGLFPRIVETVLPEPATREKARDRFRQYRAMGFEMHTHELDSDHDEI